MSRGAAHGTGAVRYVCFAVFKLMLSIVSLEQ